MHESYVLDDEIIDGQSERVIRIANSNWSHNILFDSEERQQSLLKDFLLVGNSRSKKHSAENLALDCVVRNGYPVNPPGAGRNFIPVREMIEASKLIDWLSRLTQALQSEPYRLEQMLDVVEISRAQRIETIRMRLGLKRPADGIAKPGFAREFAVIAKEAKESVQLSKDEKMFFAAVVSDREAVLITSREDVSSVITTRGSVSSKGYINWLLAEKPNTSYGASEWQSYKFTGKAFQYAAQGILKHTFDNLLVGITPSFDWLESPPGNWVLAPSLRCESPWQAICLAAYRMACGQSRLRRCPSPNCEQGLYVNNRRSDAETCGAAACDKWFYRNNPRKRKAK